MVDEVIETKDGLKLRKLVELKTSTADEYQNAMLDRVEYFKKQNEKKSVFNSSIQNTVVSTLSTVLDLKIQLENQLDKEILKKVHDFLDDFLLFGL